MSRSLILVLLLTLFCTPGFSADDSKVNIKGKVKGPEGTPIPAATISVDQLGITVNTDENGDFSLAIPHGTYSIIVEAPGFEVRGETLSTGDQNSIQLDMILPPKHLQFEEIVFASEEDSTAVSVSSPSSSINPSKQVKASSVLSAVTDVPGVAPIGQGGLFQVPSIRGAARERTLLLLEAVRVTSERRSGASFSFVDPLFLERVNITRGPAPVLYGSNGETGLIQAQLLEPNSTSPLTSFRTGYTSNINENWQALSFKDGSDKFQYTLGVVRREGGDYESGDDTEYQSGYTRINLVGKVRWFTDAGTLTFTVLPSWTDDIEKSSSDAVTRPTLYPEERHQIYMVDWQNPILQETYDLHVQGWYHPNSLITQDDRVSNGAITSRAIVNNETDDYGLRFKVGREMWDSWRIWTGVDVFGRTNVSATEDDFSASDSGLQLTDSFVSIQDGHYLDTGLFLTSTGRVGKMLTNGGLRLQRVDVGNKAGVEVSNSEYSWSGNFGGSLPFSSSWDAVFNVGRGIRPATISEKFFTGATGRGSITGNPDLVTESNFELDGGVRFHQANGFGAFYLFRNKIQDFIARVSTADDAFTYRNLDDVTIYGFEGEGFYGWNDFRFYGNFHVIQGYDAADADINDIPPSRLVAGIEYEPAGRRWLGSLELVRQFKKTDPGPDELVRDAALILNAKAEIKVIDQLRFRLFGLNLSNENYFDSADNRAPLAIGRSAGIELLTEF